MTAQQTREIKARYLTAGMTALVNAEWRVVGCIHRDGDTVSVRFDGDSSAYPYHVEEGMTVGGDTMPAPIADALRGPWLAVLADRSGDVYPTFAMAADILLPESEMTISVVRGSAMPVGDDDNLRAPGMYDAGDLIFEIDAYLIDEDDESLGAEARYAQAQAMADGLNAAGGAR